MPLKNALFVTTIACCFSQTTSPPPFFYEVASVKPNRSGAYVDHTGPGRFGGTAISLVGMIIPAFGLESYQYVFPEWMRTERYDVEAKVPPGSTQTLRRAMLQNLLIERFRLRYHYETRESTVYDLVVAKGGPKMKPSNANERANPEEAPKVKFGPDGLPTLLADSAPRTLRTGLGGQTSIVTNKLTMAKLAEMLSSQMDAPVSDRTGLTEAYSFLLHYLPTRGPRAETVADDTIPTIFDALQSQLGLKLVRRKAPVEFLLVDSAEKVPIEN